jgi:hypothetical protein
MRSIEQLYYLQEDGVMLQETTDEVRRSTLRFARDLPDSLSLPLGMSRRLPVHAALFLLVSALWGLILATALTSALS